MTERAANDWYVDQPEAIEALLRVERFSGASWDAACGCGTIPKAMRASNGYALILTPLAVARQIEREAQARGYDARVIRDQSEARAGRGYSDGAAHLGSWRPDGRAGGAGVRLSTVAIAGLFCTWPLTQWTSRTHKTNALPPS